MEWWVRPDKQYSIIITSRRKKIGLTIPANVVRARE